MGVYHRERILKTSTLSCNEEEEEITKPPPEMRARPDYFGCSQDGGAHPFLKDAPLLLSHSLSCAPVEEATEDSRLCMCYPEGGGSSKDSKKVYSSLLNV